LSGEGGRRDDSPVSISVISFSLAEREGAGRGGNKRGSQEKVRREGKAKRRPASVNNKMGSGSGGVKRRKEEKGW